MSHNENLLKLTLCPDQLSQDIAFVNRKFNEVKEADWRATFPPVILPDEQLSEYSLRVIELLELIFSIPNRIFHHDFELMMVEQGLTTDLIQRVLPFCQDELITKAKLLARPDAILTQDGFKVIEMNVSPSLGGLGIHDRYIEIFSQTALAAVLESLGIIVQAPDMTSHWQSFLENNFADLTANQCMLELHVNPTADPTANPRRPDFIQLNNHAGLKVITGLLKDVEILEEGVFYDGFKIDIIYTDFALVEYLKFYHDDASFACLCEAEKSGKVHLLSSPHACLLFENKANLAILKNNKYRHLFSEYEQQLIDTYIPETYILDKRTRLYAVEYQEQVILKPTLGMTGNNVLFGSNLSEQEWVRLLDTLIDDNETYIVQKIVQPKPLETLASYGGGERYESVMGCIIADQTFIGCLFRNKSYDGGAQVINHEQGASWCTGFEVKN